MAKTLLNRSRRARTYNLSHEQYCGDGRCRCVEVRQHSVVHDPKTGKVGIAERPKKLAASIHFADGETKSGLPDTIVNCPDIAGALERRELVEVKQESKKSAAKPAEKLPDNGAKP